MKRDKVLCSMFLFAILGVDPAQNLAKYKRWLYVPIQLTNRKAPLGKVNKVCMYVNIAIM